MTDVSTDGLVEKVRAALWDIFCPAIRRTEADDDFYRDAATSILAVLPIEALERRNAELEGALEIALANVECVEGDKCPHWVEWHHVARKALSHSSETGK